VEGISPRWRSRNCWLRISGPSSVRSEKAGPRGQGSR
jgi:hypothetical protein